MRMLLRLILILLLFDAIVFAEVRLLIVVHRHGRRSPIHYYEKDRVKYWDIAPGQLTTEGKVQEYELGVFLRKSYSNFLNSTYSPRHAYFRSTDADRTLMSAQLVATGLYPVNENQNWTAVEGLTGWQPIPISTVPYNEDSLLRAYKINCPKAEPEKQKAVSSDGKIGKFIEKHKPFLQELTKFVNKTVNVKNFTHLHDTIFNERLQNIKQPSWVSTVWPELLKMREEYATLRIPEPSLKKYYAGTFINEMMKNCEKAIKNEDQMKLYDYSAHDKTISILMSALDVHNGKIPPYSSALIFELSRQNNQNYLKIFFRNETNSTPHQLTLPKCRDCTFEEFSQLVQNLRVENLHEECQVTNASGLQSKPIFIVNIILFFIAILYIW